MPILKIANLQIDQGHELRGITTETPENSLRISTRLRLTFCSRASSTRIVYEERIMKVQKVLSVALLTTGLIAGSVSAVHADSTPVPAATNSAAYQAALAQYQIDIMKYRIELIKIAIANRAAMDKYNADWQVAVAKYYADWKVAIEAYQVLRAAYDAKIVPAAAARKAAVTKADADFLAAIGVAGATSAQLELAVKTHGDAMNAAENAFKAAVATFGAEPVKPIKPAELTKPPVPVKGVAPVKPVAPGKPAKTEKPEDKKKSEGTKKP